MLQVNPMHKSTHLETFSQHIEKQIKSTRTLLDRSADRPSLAPASLPEGPSAPHSQSHCTGSGWKNAAMQPSTLVPCSSSLSTAIADGTSSASDETEPSSVVPLRGAHTLNATF